MIALWKCIFVFWYIGIFDVVAITKCFLEKTKHKIFKKHLLNW